MAGQLGLLIPRAETPARPSRLLAQGSEYSRWVFVQPKAECTSSAQSCFDWGHVDRGLCLLVLLQEVLAMDGQYDTSPLSMIYTYKFSSDTGKGVGITAVRRKWCVADVDIQRRSTTLTRHRCILLRCRFRIDISLRYCIAFAILLRLGSGISSSVRSGH